jgi:hypothetical protein
VNRAGSCFITSLSSVRPPVGAPFWKVLKIGFGLRLDLLTYPILLLINSLSLSPGITEELEETAGQNVYEDYKFVTKAEVEELGAVGLIGTPMLKGYMHGFFMEMKLFNKLRSELGLGLGLEVNLKCT